MAGRIALVSAILIGVVSSGANMAQAADSIVTITSSADTVSAGNTLDLTTNIPAAPAGVTTQEIVTEIDPTKVQIRSVFDITYPVGWNLKFCSAADCTVAANFSSTVPSTDAQWAAVKAVKTYGSVDSQGVTSDGKQIATKTAVDTTTTSPVFTSSGGASGDGWDAFFDDRGYVFNIFHHDGTNYINQGAIDCHTKSGGACPGPAGTWPMPLAPLQTNNLTGWIDPRTHYMWIHIADATSIGFVCLDMSDMANRKYCGGSLATGFHRLASKTNGCSSGSVANACAQAFAHSGNRVFTWNWLTGNLLCIDVTLDGGNGAACPGTPLALPGITHAYEASMNGANAFQVWGGHLYGMVEGANAICLIPDTLAPCPGWGSTGVRPLTHPTGSLNTSPAHQLLQIPDAQGNVVAICYWFPLTSGAAGQTPDWDCYDYAGTETKMAGASASSSYLTSADMAALNTGQDKIWWAEPNVQLSGSKVFWGEWSSLIHCWDISFHGWCTTTGVAGGPLSFNGATGKSDSLYTLRVDPYNVNCIWTVADDGSINSWDAKTGAAGCQSLPMQATFSSEAVVPRMGCSGNANVSSWGKFTLKGPAVYSGATLTVQDSAGMPIPSWSNIPITSVSLTNSSWKEVDLSGLLVSLTGQNPAFIVKFATRGGTDSASASISAIGEAPQLCVTPIAILPCPAVAIGPISQSMLVDVIATVLGRSSMFDISNNATALPPDNYDITVSKPASLAECGSRLSGIATETGTSTKPIIGVLVSLLKSDGTPVLGSDGQPVTTTTAADGTYSFGYLVPNSYKVLFGEPTTTLHFDVASVTAVSGATGTITTAGATIPVSATSATSNVAFTAVGTPGVVNAEYVIPISATPDTTSGPMNTAQTSTVKANDVMSTGFVYSSSKLCSPTDVAPTCTATSVTIAGEGTYSINSSTGVITFIPVTGFTGTATPATYSVSDNSGRTASSTYTPTVIPDPVAVNDATSGPFNTPQTIVPTANDTSPDNPAGDPYSTINLVPAGICAVGTADASCTATTLTVANQGTYTLNTTTGVITFTPLNTFTGTATPVQYMAKDAAGNLVPATYTPTVTPPVAGTASPDTTTDSLNINQTINPLTNDSAVAGTTLTATSVKLCGAMETAPNCTQTTVNRAEGSYTVNATTGVITFNPNDTFIGTAEPITYIVKDTLNRTLSSTYTPTVVGPTLSKSFSPGTVAVGEVSSLTFTLTNTADKTVKSGLGFTDTLPAGLVVAANPNIQTNCPGGATWGAATQLSATAGSNTIVITGAGITANVVSCQFRINVVSASAGNYANGPDNITNATGLTEPTDDVTLKVVPVSTPGAFICLADQYITETAGQLAYYTPSTGDLRNIGLDSAADPDAIGFNQLDGFVYGIARATSGSITLGDLVKISSDGTVTSLGKPTVAGVATAVPIGSFPAGTMDDSGHLLVLMYGTTQLWSIDVATGKATKITMSQNVNITDMVFVGGKIVGIYGGYRYTIDPVTGAVVFVATPAGWTGNHAGGAFMDVTGNALFAESSGATYSVAGILGTSSAMTRVALPAAGLSLASDGASCSDSTPPPAAFPDVTSGKPLQTQNINPLTNDLVTLMDTIPSTTAVDPATFVATSVKLCDTSETAPSCTLPTKSVAGVGTYSVNQTTGALSFTPEAGFTGTAAAQPYQVTDSTGQVATSTYTPTVVAPPVAVNDTSSGAYLAPQTVIPTTNDSPGAGATTAGVSLLVNSVKLCGPSENAPNCSQTSVTVDGQGTYTVNPTNGAITFTPVTGFTGTATPMPYTVIDTLGQNSSATYTPTVNPVPMLSKVFTPGKIAAGGVATLTFKITNTAGNPAWTGLAFTDTLPAGLKVDTTPNKSTTCPGGSTVALNPTTMTATAGSSTISFASVALTAGVASCTFSVSVTADASGTYANGFSNISSTTVVPPTTATVVAVETPADSFFCSPYVYHVDAGQLNMQDPSNGTSYPIGAASAAKPNGVGYSSADGYIYGFASVAATGITAGHLVRYSNDGTLTDMGAPLFTGSGTTGQTAPGYAAVNQGDFDAAGNLYFRTPTTAGTVLYSINVSTLVVTQYTLTSAWTTAGDFTFQGGKLYSLRGVLNGAAMLDIVDLTAKTVTSQAITGLPTTSTLLEYSAAYANSAGELMFVNYGNGVTYRINDAAATTPTFTALSTGTASVVNDGAMCHDATAATAPTATADTSTGVKGATQTIKPITNDTQSLSSTGTISPASVKLCAPGQSAPNCSSTSLTVDGEGTYTVDPVSGDVSFVPLSTFVGVATPVKYQITDTNGLTASSTITPTVIGPPAPVNDSSSGAYGATQTKDPLANDALGVAAPAGTSLDKTTVKLCSGTDVAPNCTKTSVTTSQGTYSVDPVSGVITFVPAVGFFGTATPLPYSVTDSLGGTSSATYTPTVGLPPAPTASPNTTTGAFDTSQTVNVLTNDATGAVGISLVATSVKLCDTGETSPNCTKTSLDVPNQGTYTVNTATGIITFDPLPTFTGTATQVSYQVTDSSGQKATSQYTPTVNPPPLVVLAPDATSGVGGVAQTVSPLANDTTLPAGVTLQASTLKICNNATPQVCGTTSVTVPEGTYSVDPSTGVISFMPNAGFSGTPTPLTYQVTDSVGRPVTSTYQPTVTPPPVAHPDTATTPWDTNVTLTPVANDTSSATTLNPIPVGLCAAGTAAASCTATTLTVPQQGTYTLNSDGTVTFDPLPSFTGPATAIGYAVVDSLGQKTTSTIRPTVSAPPVPDASPETKLVAPGGTVAFTTTNGTNGLTISGGPALASVCIIDPATSLCDTNNSVSIPGEGVYTLNPVTGIVTFAADPAATSSTTLTPITYKVTDITGASDTSTLTPIIPPPPVLRPDTASGQQGTTLTLNLLSNDAPGSSATSLVPSSVKICDPATSVCGTTDVTIAGKGVYSLNPTTGIVTFTPEPGFTGVAPPLNYTVADSVGQVATGTITVTELPPPATYALPNTGNANYGLPVTFTPLSNDSAGTIPITGGSSGYTSVGTATLDKNSLKLIDPVTGNAVTTLTTPEGVYVVDTSGATAKIIFTPATGFSGTPVSPPTYKVCNTIAGDWQPSAPPASCATSTVTPTIAPPSNLSAVPDTNTENWDTVQNISVLTNDTHDPLVSLVSSTLHLCGPGQTAPNCTATTLVVPGEGTYTVNQLTGSVSFDPIPSFTGDATPVTYVVKSSDGQSTSSTITPTVNDPAVPVATPDTVLVAVNGTATFDPITSGSGLASGTSLQPSKTFLCDPNTTPAEVAPNCTKTSVTIAGEGTYTLNQTTGVVTFADVSPTAGVKTPITYMVTDVTGQTATSTLTPTVVTPPTAQANLSSGAYNQVQTINVLLNDSVSNPTATSLVPSTLKLCAAGESAPNCSATSVTVPGEGTYAVSGGVVSFTPATGFTGTVTTPVSYQVADTLGQVATAPITPTVTTITPVAQPDTGVANYNQPVTFTPSSNDSGGSAVGLSGYNTVGSIGIDNTTVRLCGPGEVAPNCTQFDLTTPDGTFHVNIVSGEVTFTPEPGFVGTSAFPATYEICNQTTGWSPSPAVTCVSSTLTPTINPPVASAIPPTDVTTPWDTAVVIDPLVNATLDPAVTLIDSTLKLCDPTTNPAQQAPGCTLTTLTVPGKGTFTVSPTTGTVSFDPLPTFSGDVPVVSFQVTDSKRTVVGSTITVHVPAPPAPVATPEQLPVVPRVATPFNNLFGDTPLATGTQLQDPCFVSGSTCVTTLSTPSGIWTVDTATGIPSFTAFASAAPGPTAPVTYRVTDVTGQAATSTLTPVIPAVGVLQPDTKTAPFNTAATEVVTTNDSAGTGGSTLVAATLTLCPVGATSNCSATSVTVNKPGTTTPAGTYTVDPALGTVTFTPEPGFTGTAPPVTYAITDTYGRTLTTTYTPTIGTAPLPVAVDDVTSGKQGRPQRINLLTNSVSPDHAGHASLELVPSSVLLRIPGTSNYSPIVTVQDVGTYSVDSTGAMLFEPVTFFTGTPAALTYQVADTAGNVTLAAYTPTVVAAPVLTPDTSTGVYNTPQSKTVLVNDTNVDPSTTLDATTLTLLDSSGNPVTSVQIPNEGTYTFDVAQGLIIFTPVASFTGTATAVTYQVSDALGQAATTTYTPTVTPPAAPVLQPDTTTDYINTDQSKNVLTNDTSTLVSGQTLTATSVKLFDPTSGSYVTTPVTLADGVYSLELGSNNLPTGVVLFTPALNFTGTAEPVTYQVTTNTNQSVTSTYTPIVTGPPAPVADAKTGPYNTPVSKDVLTNDAPYTGTTLVSSTLKIYNRATSSYGTTPVTVNIPNTTTPAGTYTVSGTEIVFTPTASFTGTAPAITYQITDSLQHFASTTYTPTITPPPAPTAVNDVTGGVMDAPQTSAVVGNDVGLTSGTSYDVSSLALCDPTTSPAQVSPNCTDTSVTVTGGTYTLVTVAGVPTGSILFTPTPGFIGTAPSVTYQVDTNTGQSASATYTPTLIGPPVVQPDTSTGDYNTAQLQRVLLNDAAATGTTLVPSSLVLIEPGTLQVATGPVITADGTFTIATASNGDKTIVFTPRAGFIGEADAVPYRISDALGQTSDTSYTPTVTPPPAPVAVNDSTTGLINAAQSIDVTANDDQSLSSVVVDPTTLLLCTSAGVCGVSDITVADGTYSLVVDSFNVPTGVIRFVPDSGFVGAPTPVTYKVAMNTGQTATAVYSPAVVPLPALSPDTTSGAFNTLQKSVVTANDITSSPTTLDFGTVKLFDPTTQSFVTTSVTNSSGTYSISTDCTPLAVAIGTVLATTSNVTCASITFMPATDFTGPAIPVTYQVTDIYSQLSTTTYTPTVNDPLPPQAVNDTGHTQLMTPITLNVIANDVRGGYPLDSSSILLCGDQETSPNCAQTTVQVFTGEFTLNPDHTVKFTPNEHFVVGVNAVIDYLIADSDGNITSATITIDVPPAPIIPPEVAQLVRTGVQFFSSPAVTLPLAVGALVGGLALYYTGTKRPAPKREPEINA